MKAMIDSARQFGFELRGYDRHFAADGRRGCARANPDRGPEVPVCPYCHPEVEEVESAQRSLLETDN
jgi:hypothetical protein